MTKKSLSRCGFFSRRALIAFLCAAAACSVLARTFPATAGRLVFFPARVPAQGPGRTLTFEERVAYQRAIEEVYWRHRIWPKERPDPKPSLASVMSQAHLENKVQDYLLNSEALEDYWQRPITAEQLQAEMERMAQHTKQSEVLRELFEALGNDPFVIAECLARPALAERLLTGWYAFDQRIHGQLKERAENDLQAHNTILQMKELSGEYSEIELLKSDAAQAQDHRRFEHGVKLDGREWDRRMHRLTAIFDRDHSVTAGLLFAQPTRLLQHKRIPVESVLPVKDGMTQIKPGVFSPLREDEGRYYVMAVIQKSKDRLKLATVSWRKKSLESWRGSAANQMPHLMSVPGGNYTLPKIAAGTDGCVFDTWAPMAAAPDRREGHTAVWTGTEMIVWGGQIYETSLSSGGRYNPATDIWSPTTNLNAPSARYAHTAVWTGNEMVVWGGIDENFVLFDTGGRYNPATDSWTPTSTTDAPSARFAHTAVWTGSEMIVWSGAVDSGDSNTGGSYSPDSDSWTATSTTNTPMGRGGHTAVWTGDEMIVWGGVDENSFYVNTGGRYNPASNSWTATSITSVPDARSAHTAVWTGDEMIVWGGGDFSNTNNYFNTGGRYNPGTNSWTATTTTNAPSARAYHTAVWTGTAMLVWGGATPNGDSNTGGGYTPGTNTWTTINSANAPAARASHTAVWTGSEMVVWGGGDGFSDLNTGGRYNPDTNDWTNTGGGNTPSSRDSHTAVWTGSEMIVWGGENQDFGVLGTGARYAPSTDSWIPMSTTNAPWGRASHSAVWTGSEMIVWGGFDEIFPGFNTGGRYNPVADDWIATSTVGAPVARFDHSAVWTGSEMIVWGGEDADFALSSTGGRYNPGTDNWVATSTINAPTARDSHTATWTGSEMIVWGGLDENFVVLNTGGRYNPGANGWMATSTTMAPTRRGSHTAVWSGSEIIVWGGVDFATSNYFDTGGRYNPGTDRWTATSTTDAPSGRAGHTAVWTGNEMIIWGGGDSSDAVNTGGKYDPRTRGWTSTTTTDAPSARAWHTAVWTGSEMFIWGGLKDNNLDLNTGGRYCAQLGPTPTPTPCTGRCAPTPRPRPSSAPRPTAR